MSTWVNDYIKSRLAASILLHHHNASPKFNNTNKGLVMGYLKKHHKSVSTLEIKKFRPSLLALCVMAVSIPGFAQEQSDAEAAEVEEVLVTGMRQSLSSAQDLKRNADTVVDSITAKDLGSFPDKSVAEALQRVAGVTVNRFAASSDTAHFSAEPSGVLVRGLNQVRTEFNGRDSFSANSSRGLSWGDISPELMSGVDTYKNQTAELIEGGIAGTVNMRTRVPFDQPGQLVSVSTSMNYGDLSKETTPEFSGLYSNRWETNAGEFGFLGNFAFSKVETRSEGNQLGRMNRFRNVYNDDIADGGAQLKFIPGDITFRDNMYERERTGGALAFQWQDPNQEFIATLQYNRSEYENSWRERGLQAFIADESYGQSLFYEVPAGSSPRAFDPNNPDAGFVFSPGGHFQSGSFVRGDYGWWGMPGALDSMHLTGVNAAGEQFIQPCYDWDANCTSPYPNTLGAGISTFGRWNQNTNMTQDFGVNLKWAPTDHVRANFDLQYVDSTVENYDISIGNSSVALVGVDVSGGRPAVVLSESPNVNYSPGFLSNPNNYWIDNIMDHIEDSEGHQFSARMDFEFDLDVDWATSVKMGARYADRDQVVRWSGYNWNAIAPDWVGYSQPRAAWANLDRHSPDTEYGSSFIGFPQGHYQVIGFQSGFHNLSATELVFPNVDYMSDRQRMVDTMSAQALGLPGNGNGGWDPVCSNVGKRAGEIDGTCFTPAEIADVNEESTALYVQLNFGGKDSQIFGMDYSGNLGVRYVKTDLVSAGGISMPVPYSSDELNCEDNIPEDPNAVVVPKTLGCYLSADDIAFANGASILSDAKSSYHNWLPSFNFKLEPVDGLVIRYAWSTAMARPDMGNLRNYIQVQKTAPSITNVNDPLWVKDDAGEIVGANIYYNGDAHNPYLKPIEAKQQDLSFEYYWSNVGSAAITLFEKRFDNYIQYGADNIQFNNGGVDRIAEIGRPRNGDGANIRGVELAYQTFFDFLPSPFDGLGVQANYTYIDNKGITNTNVSSTDPNGGTVIGEHAPDMVNVGVLEGLSKDSYNLIGMYEKGDWALRLAYSWRSEYLVTARDCCVVYPVWNEDQGHLDGSIRYNLNENVELSFQGSNLLNTTTKLRQQVSDTEDGGTKLATSWFQNDRRFTLGVRIHY